MKRQLEKLDSSKFKKLENEDLKNVLGGIAQQSTFYTAGQYNTYVMAPSGDYIPWEDTCPDENMC
jgi:hypothetical protein